MDDFWQYCLTQLRENVDSATFSAFIEPASLRKEEDRLLIVSPNRVTERWLKENVNHSLQAMMKDYFKDNLPSLAYLVESSGSPSVADKISDDSAKISKNKPKTTQLLSSGTKRTDEESGLRASLTFASFVKGEANDIPLAAAKGIARGDNHISPLFIFGNTGLGKTHLAQAIGNEYQKNHPQRKILYLSSRRFMSEVVNACRFNQHDTLKDRFYGVNMLILDDIQHLGGNKARTQEELFALFNTLHEEEKEIIITGDSSPIYLKDIPTHLTSRFGCGVVTNITPPEFNLRVGILHQKAKEMQAVLEEAVVHFIAEHIKSNVRILEGALKRLLAAARFKDEKPSINLCRQVLSDLIGKSNAKIQPDLIKEKVAKFFNLQVSDLSSKGRQQSIVRPRHIAIYLCRKLTTMSLPEIGLSFGKRNHTTVLHSCRHIEQKITADKKLSEDIQQLITIIKE